MSGIHKAFRASIAIVLALGLVAAILVIEKHTRMPHTVSEVLQRMEQFRHNGRYDDAISVGTKWAEKFPQNGSNDQVFGRIAFLYLEKAKKGEGEEDKDVAEALRYRDKMLPVASDTELGLYSAAALKDAAFISEAAGDLSVTQRCVQYQNALRLLERLAYSLHNQQVALSNRTGSKRDEFGYTTEDVNQLLTEAQASASRVHEKQKKSECKWGRSK